MPPSTICSWFCASSASDVGGGVEILDLDLDADFLEVALLDRPQVRDGRDRAHGADLDGDLLGPRDPGAGHHGQTGKQYCPHSHRSALPRENPIQCDGFFFDSDGALVSSIAIQQVNGNRSLCCSGFLPRTARASVRRILRNSGRSIVRPDDARRRICSSRTSPACRACWRR